MAASSTFEINDTLQITKDQWFPLELDIDQHLINSYSLDTVDGKIYQFKNKPGLRNFSVPPVRCFLVENRDSKRIYRWQCHILSVTVDYITRETSGIYKIIKLFTPEQMKQAFFIADRFEEMNYFTTTN